MDNNDIKKNQMQIVREMLYPHVTPSVGGGGGGGTLEGGSYDPLQDLLSLMGALVESNGDEPLTSGLLGLLSMNADRELYIASIDRIVNSLRMTILNTIWAHSRVGETIADVTNGAAATYNYYIDMQYFNHFALQGILADSPTVKVYATRQNDGTAAASITAWEDFSTLFLGGASATSTFDASDASGIFGGVRYIKVEVVSTTGTEDWTLYASRWYA